MSKPFTGPKTCATFSMRGLLTPRSPGDDSSTMRAFSLIELSIVLVILGLLTGGILAGQSLIRAAELRAVSTEYSRYATASSTFRDKYFALPGDMTNATKFWGQSANCPGTYLQGTTDGTTCDGNGDGRVHFSGSTTPATTSELFRFWQHLGSAGLIEGRYNGVTAATDNYVYAAGESNTPASKVGNGRWSLMTAVNTAGGGLGNGFWYDYSRPYHFSLGAVRSNSWNYGLIFKSEEAWNIDTKMDDGKPGMGIVLSTWNSACTDASDGSVKTANYTLASPGLNCMLFLRGN